MKSKKSNLDLTIEKNRLDKAAGYAEEYLRKIYMMKAPVDPLAVAAVNKPRLIVIGDDFRNRFDGQIRYNRPKNRFILFYNNKYNHGLPPNEQHPRTRFSIAHELGHFVLPEHRAYLMKHGKFHNSKSEFKSDNVIEKEADAFAASLLMPEELFRPTVNNSELTIDNIKLFTAYFKTSLVSTSIRGVQLSDFPCAIVAIRDGRIAWSFQSKSLIEAGCYPPLRSVPKSKTAQEQWRIFEKGPFEETASPGYISDWFRIYERDHLKYVHVSEYYLPVPIMGTLLVLLTIPEDELFAD